MLTDDRSALQPRQPTCQRQQVRQLAPHWTQKNNQNLSVARQIAPYQLEDIKRSGHLVVGHAWGHAPRLVDAAAHRQREEESSCMLICIPAHATRNATTRAKLQAVASFGSVQRGSRMKWRSGRHRC